MSSHEITLAMIDEKIEATESQRRSAEADRLMKQAAVDRAKKELELIDFTLKELRNSKACLEFDRSANRVS